MQVAAGRGCAQETKQASKQAGNIYVRIATTRIVHVQRLVSKTIHDAQGEDTLTEKKKVSQQLDVHMTTKETDAAKRSRWIQAEALEVSTLGAGRREGLTNGSS